MESIITTYRLQFDVPNLTPLISNFFMGCIEEIGLGLELLYSASLGNLDDLRGAQMREIEKARDCISFLVAMRGGPSTMGTPILAFKHMHAVEGALKTLCPMPQRYLEQPPPSFRPVVPQGLGSQRQYFLCP
jgi:hypothetical protein